MRFPLILTSLFILVFGYSKKLHAQKIVLNIQVVDANDQSIPGAIITGITPLFQTSSDIDGFVVKKLKLENDSIIFQVNHTGYLVKKIALLNTDELFEKPYKVVLQYRSLKEVTIEKQRDNTSTFQKLDEKAATEVASPTGEFLNSTLATQAGVSVTNELSASYSVRGGSYDENLVYLNGIEIYRPFLVRAGQQEGLSFINPNLVGSVNFSAGGFAAEYGDKLSSALDVHYKKPSSFGGTVELGLLSESVSIEGISKNNKLTYLSAVRYRKNGNVLKSLDEQGEYAPRFADFQTLLTYKINPTTSVDAFVILSSNKYQFTPQSRKTELGSFQVPLQFTVFFDGKEQSTFNSALGAVQFNKQVNNTNNFKLTLSRFVTEEKEEFDIIGQYSLDEVQKDLGADDFGEVVANYAVGGFLNHARNRIFAEVNTVNLKWFSQLGEHYIKAGAEARFENVVDRLSEWVYLDSADFAVPRNEPNNIILTDLIKANNTYNAQRYSFFVQDALTKSISETKTINLTAGIRAYSHSYTGEFIVSPRMAIAYKPSWRKQINDSTVIKKDITIRLAGGAYSQAPFYRELRNYQNQLNPNMVSQKSWQISAGIDYNLFIWNRPFKFIAETYFKYLYDVTPYKLENIRVKYFGTNNATATAYGADFKLHGEFIPGTESWATISTLSVQENISGDNYTIYRNAAGERINALSGDQNITDSTVVQVGNIPRPNDQRINFGMFLRDELLGNPDFKVQLSFIFGTGLPYGPPSNDRYRDTLRTPSYKRVDIGFSYDLISDDKPGNGFFSKFKKAALYLEVFNLLAIRNTVNYQWIKDVNNIQYPVPNYLTGRRVNLKLRVEF